MFKGDAKTLLFFLISALCIVHHIESLTLSSDSSIRHNPISVVNAVGGVKTLFATSIWDWEVKQSEIEISENELDLTPQSQSSECNLPVPNVPWEDVFDKW